MNDQKDDIGVEIIYCLTGSGWATCHVTVGPQHADISASYLSDALGELTTAVLRLRNGATESTNSFDEEPGEYRWRFSRNEDELHLRILWLTELWGDQPDEEGKVVLDARCSVNSFVQALVKALERILEKPGVDGYKADWLEHDFPMEDYNKLKL